MITVHHLNNSRSQRVLWLLEELGLPYQVKCYERNPTTLHAPAALRAVHPLGKSPTITDGDLTLAESGAILEYLVERAVELGLQPRLAPLPGTPERLRYAYWMHYAEGSAMLPLLMALFMGFIGEGGAPLRPHIDAQIADHLSYMEQGLGGRPFFVGKDLTGADIQLLFVLEAAGSRLTPYTALAAYRDRMHARPAYQRGIEKGGPYQLMSR
jgi:glutathione S-transferase